MWTTRLSLSLRLSPPFICVRQLASPVTITSASALSMFVDLILEHRPADLRHFDREQAAEAAALIRAGQLGDGHALDRLAPIRCA